MASFQIYCGGVHKQNDKYKNIYGPDFICNKWHITVDSTPPYWAHYTVTKTGIYTNTFSFPTLDVRT